MVVVVVVVVSRTSKFSLYGLRGQGCDQKSRGLDDVSGRLPRGTHPPDIRGGVSESVCACMCVLYVCARAREVWGASPWAEYA